MTYTLKQNLPSQILKRRFDTLVYTHTEHLLNKFRDEAIVKGVSFKNSVPVVNDFPDCWKKQRNKINYFYFLVGKIKIYLGKIYRPLKLIKLYTLFFLASVVNLPMKNQNLKVLLLLNLPPHWLMFLNKPAHTMLFY